jgi:hypothetical protein
MNIGTITIGRVEDMEPREADRHLADNQAMLAQLIVDLNQEVEKLQAKVDGPGTGR